jgi:hypothetical protein
MTNDSARHISTEVDDEESDEEGDDESFNWRMERFECHLLRPLALAPVNAASARS